jgi:hypothetical protein
LHEAAAIETARVAATVPVGHAAVRKGGIQECRALRFGQRRKNPGARGRRCFRKRSRRSAFRCARGNADEQADEDSRSQHRCNCSVVTHCDRYGLGSSAA